MGNRFAECQRIHEMEEIICRDLEGKQFWGDINLSYEEYELLRDRIKALFVEEKHSLDFVEKGFPVALTTLMVFLARYKYNTNFWRVLGEEIGISLSHLNESALGTVAKMTFSQKGFDFSDVKQERRVNLEPIFYEAGLPPESSLNDLFYVLHYDSHRVFDPQSVIDDLTEARSYQIRKPMLKFLRRFKGDRAVEFVMEVREAMLCADQGMPSDSHYVGNYVEWKKLETTRENIRTRKKQEFQTRPYISFDMEKYGLCVVLPRVLLEDEWIENVYWRVTADNGKVERKMSVFGESGRYIESINVPVCPAPKYHVELINEECYDTKPTLSAWDVDGIPFEGYALFNAQGRLMGSKNQYIPYPTGVLVYGMRASITNNKNVVLANLAYPTGRPEYRICSIEVSGNYGSLTVSCIAGLHVIVTRPHIEMRLSGTTLFGITASDGYRLFTEPPVLIVDTDEESQSDDYFIRFGDQNIAVGSLFEAGNARIPLKNLSNDSFTKYGTYSLRLYQKDHFIKQTEFTLVPRIETDYSPLISWNKAILRTTKLKYRFARKPQVQFEFDQCFVSNTAYEYIVECKPEMGVIPVSMTITTKESSFTVNFELPISPVECELVEEDGERRRIPLGRSIRLSQEKYEGKKNWLSLRFLGAYRDGKYLVQLRSVDGVVQQEMISQTRNGSVNLDLAVFSDTIRNCPLPVAVELCQVDDEEKAASILVISDTVQIEGRPSRYWPDKKIIGIPNNACECDITVVNFRNPSERIRLLRIYSVISKSGLWRGYPCERELAEGFYVIEANRNASAFEFEDESVPRLTNTSETLYFSLRNTKDPIVSFSDWLDQLVVDILDAGQNRDLSAKMSYQLCQSLDQFRDKNRGTIALSRFDCERIIALVHFATAVCCKAKKNDLAVVITSVAKMLNSQSRLALLQTLADLQTPQDIFDECVTQFQLLLFRPGGEGAIALADAVEEYSLEIPLMLRMGADDSLRNTICRERYREIVGQEAIRDFLFVPDLDDAVEFVQEQRKFLREQPSKVRIRLTKDVSGDMGPISDMVKYTYRKVYFDRSAKPDVGVYFDRIRYVDQYVNWFFSHTDKEGDINSVTQKEIREIVSINMKNILEAFKRFKTFSELSVAAKEYEAALKSRISGNGDLFANMSSAIPWRYFYVQGIAAFITQLPAEYHKYGADIRPAEAFMTAALHIAPRISQRDILMANMFLYLTRKEKKLCQ